MKNENVVAATNDVSWRVPALDGLRAVAMLMVYAYHVWMFCDKPVKIINIAGYEINLLGVFAASPARVDFFMVLSGFCLFLPLCKPNVNLDKWDARNFFARRVRRIVPPYYAAIVYSMLMPQLLVIVFRLLGQEADWRTFPTLFDLTTHLLFIHTFFISTWDGISGSFWSLSVEAQFYLAFPLLIFGFRKYGTKVIWAMLAISILYRLGVFLVMPRPSSWIEGFLPTIFFLGRWMQFGAGMGGAWIVAQHWKAGKWLSPKLGTVAILAGLMIYCLAVWEPVEKIRAFPLRDSLLAICFAVVIAAVCITKTPLRALFENKVMVWLGLLSYSFFLIHQNTAFYLEQLLEKKLHLNGFPLFLIMCSGGFLVVLGISYAFFLVFEKPFLRKPKERVAPESGLTPVSVPVK